MTKEHYVKFVSDRRHLYINKIHKISISSKMCVWLVFINTMVYRNSCTLCKQCRPDQMPHSVASDLGLHCLPMSPLRDARLKWVKFLSYNSEFVIFKYKIAHFRNLCKTSSSKIPIQWI